MKSRALKLAFCLEMRRNIITGPESASHPGLRGHLVNEKAVLAQASCCFLHSSIHPSIHLSSMHIVALPLPKSGSQQFQLGDR